MKYPKFWNNLNIISIALFPFSYVYKLLGFIRKKTTKTEKYPFLVVCVGNITVGGTGKTQVVKVIAENISEYNFCILSKAINTTKRYDAKLVSVDDFVDDVGDEAMMLCKDFSVISYTKLKSALYLARKIGYEIVIMDDGMQNPAVFKDIEIMVIDSNRLFGNGMLIPAGPLRERNLRETIVYVGTESIIPKSKLDKQKKYLLFAGIGNPQRFFDTVKKMNVEVIKTFEFPDHHNFSSSELEQIILEAGGCEIITTHKDYVKIPNHLRKYFKYLEVTLAIDENILKKILLQIYSNMANRNKN